MTSWSKRGNSVGRGRLARHQFDVLFTDDLYTRISRNAIETANALKKGLAAKGYRFFMDSPTNQLFVVLENTQLTALEGGAVRLLGGSTTTDHRPHRHQLGH